MLAELLSDRSGWEWSNAKFREETAITIWCEIYRLSMPHLQKRDSEDFKILEESSLFSSRIREGLWSDEGKCLMARSCTGFDKVPTYPSRTTDNQNLTPILTHRSSLTHLPSTTTTRILNHTIAQKRSRRSLTESSNCAREGGAIKIYNHPNARCQNLRCEHSIRTTLRPCRLKAC